MLTLLGLGLMGQALRLLDSPGAPLPGAVVLVGGDSAATAASQRAEAERARRPLELGERIDVDAAPARELMRLPGVGAGTARAIEEDRLANGPYGALEALGRVRGIGARTLERLRPHVRFSAPPSPPGAPAGRGVVSLNRADSTALLRLPGIGPALAGRILARRRSHGAFRVVDDLLAVPGIGPKTLDRLRPLVRTD